MLRWTIFASVPLCLLLTGCPLTDHYRLQEDTLGSAGTHQGGEPGADASAGNELSNAGLAERGGGANAGCDVACSVNRPCVADHCTSGWASMADPPSMLVARSKAASVAMGNAVFIWGGLDSSGAALENGAIYDAQADTWTYLPRDTGSPSARIMATAVWTGSASNKVILYGGSDAAGGMIYRDGAVYDVLGNSWSALPGNMMLSKRSAPYGYWDGTRAVFFGGQGGMMTVVPGADRFDLKGWSTSMAMGDPGLLGFPAIAFDGSVMYLQGGVIMGMRQDKVFAYTSSTDTWSSLSKSLSPRTGAFGAWDGSAFVVWGGEDDMGMRADGKTMTGTRWSEMTEPSTLSPRRIAFRRSGWAFQVEPGVVGIIGGQTSTLGTGSVLATDGATYAVQSGEWTEIPSWPSLESHEYGIGVWTGKEFVLWGGRTQNLPTLTGERWTP
ncbi:MAG TPA: hypothetical protein VER12_20725 [Polyangiaceae bacterium]|nr:hypothetical protein [Polyangiaceae bacterium]